MKYIYTLITLLTFICCSSNEQVKPQITTPNQNIHKLEQRITKLENEDLSKNLIQEYKDLNSLYNNGFAVLLTLFGLIFPALIYFIQIVPAQNILKEAKLLQHKLESDFEKSFDEHFKKRKDKIIDEAIETYERLDEQFLPTSYTNLDTYKSEKFSIIQIIRLIALLKRNDISEGDKYHFARILTFQKSNEIENYFVELLSIDPKNGLCIWGALYFASNKKTEYYNLIADVVINGYSLIAMYSSLSYHSRSFAIDFFNNEKLVENLQGNFIRNFCDHANSEKFDKVDLMNIKKTAIWNKYIELQSNQA